jgi:hypothetical protein
MRVYSSALRNCSALYANRGGTKSCGVNFVFILLRVLEEWAI